MREEDSRTSHLELLHGKDLEGHLRQWAGMIFCLASQVFHAELRILHSREKPLLIDDYHTQEVRRHMVVCAVLALITPYAVPRRLEPYFLTTFLTAFSILAGALMLH